MESVNDSELEVITSINTLPSTIPGAYDYTTMSLTTDNSVVLFSVYVFLATFGVFAMYIACLIVFVVFVRLLLKPKRTIPRTQNLYAEVECAGCIYEEINNRTVRVDMNDLVSHTHECEVNTHSVCEVKVTEDDNENSEEMFNINLAFNNNVSMDLVATNHNQLHQNSPGNLQSNVAVAGNDQYGDFLYPTFQ